MNNQKGNLYLIIAIIVGLFAIGAVGFASWKYFGGGSELEKNGNEIIKPLIERKTEKLETVHSLTDQELKIKWDVEKKKTEIDGKIMAIADMNNDGKNDLIIAMPTQSDEEWHDDYITIFSWNNNEFIPIWKSADKFSIRDLYVGDVNNNGKNNIIISSSTNFPDYYYFMFEIDNTSPKNDEWNEILKEAVNKYWKSLESSSSFNNYWYWKINTIADKDNDNKQELLIDVFFLPDDSAPYSELLTLQWDENNKCFYKQEKSFEEITNWKTYQNTKYGYEIKYPKDWNIQNIDSVGNLGAQHAIKFLKQENDLTYKFEFFIFDNLSDQKWYTKEVLDDVETVMIDNKVSAFKGETKYDVSPALVSFWTYESKAYLFRTLPRMNEERFVDIFEQILSTFKFTE